jgi:zinc/manganese transport system permease protein
VGDLLTVTWPQIWRTAALFAAIGLVHVLFRKRFITLSFDHEAAERAGWSVRWWDFLFYALFGLVVTSFVQVGGVLLVFSYLIVPAVCANYLSRTLLTGLGVGWVVATLSSVAGLYASYELDLPTGAAVVCVLGVAMVLAAVAGRWRLKRRQPGPMLRP